ncbi:MAG TPA: AAA family ATPase [Acidimicrobiales bacterium]|nr:AAA family ATPase [Acidimicrobiales bacterium]
MAAERLWEREEQLAAVGARIAAAREGRGGALFVLGEAGLGKTSVLDEACRRAGDDLVLASARCDPMEVSLPFGLLSQVVHALGGAEDLWTATDHADARTAALYRTLRWLEEVASGPILITIDDLQWADPDSLALLGFLCRRVGSLPVAVVASLRPWPAAAADVAWSLVRRGDATVEPLLPLTEEAAAGVLSEKVGRPVPTDVARRAWRLSGGNPLLLGLAAGVLTLEGVGSTDAEGLPVSVVERSLVLGRFAGLTSAGRRWAEAAAVLGIEFRSELVSDVAGLDGDATTAAAEAVWRSGLVRAGKKGTAEFVHPVFGQLLYEDITPPARARLHARAFTALTARGMDDVAAEHAIRADLTGDAHAIRVLTESGRRALRAGAPATAASRLQAAVRLSGSAAAAPLPVELGEALLEAGRAAEAASIIGEVLETDVPPTQRVSALTMLSRAHFAMGDFDAAGATLEAAVALAEQESPHAVVLPLCRHADAVMMTAGPAAALPLALRARHLAQSGDNALQSRASAKWGMLAFYCGDRSGLVTVESEARHLVGASRSQLAADIRSGGTGILLPFACVAMPAERFAEAETAIRAGIDEAERAGAVTAAAALGIVYGLMLLRIRVCDSFEVADRLLAVADLVPLAEPFAGAIRSYALLEMGEEERSATERARAQPAAARYRIWGSLLWLDHVHGLRLLRHGRFEEASEVYAGIEERYRELGIGEPCLVPWARHATVAHARAGHISDAERVVDWLEERAGHLPCRWPNAAAAAGRALFALLDDDHARADAAYRDALAHLDGTSLPLERAELMIEHGSMLRRDGRPREARESFRRAGEVAESVGAVWLARRAGEELAASGGRRRMRRGAQELTAQEQRIARLTATGASDKDIAAHLVVSVRTVRTHLEHVYTKLGIHSRRELMAMGDRLEDLIKPKG